MSGAQYLYRNGSTKNPCAVIDRVRVPMQIPKQAPFVRDPPAPTTVVVCCDDNKKEKKKIRPKKKKCPPPMPPMPPPPPRPRPCPPPPKKDERVCKEGKCGPKGDKGEKGDRGSTGPPGNMGPQGPPGIGVKGDRGKTGPEGKRGLQGEAGCRGERGDRGKTGPKGEQGQKGERGERGHTGPPGMRGEQGPEGQRGRRGDRGTTGPRGDQGERGEKGERGQQGMRGQTGPQGGRGEQGFDGPRGKRGEKGERGPEGPPGCEGKRGERGEPGPPGQRGPPGIIACECTCGGSKSDDCCSPEIDLQQIANALLTDANFRSGLSVLLGCANSGGKSSEACCPIPPLAVAGATCAPSWLTFSRDAASVTPLHYDPRPFGEQCACPSDCLLDGSFLLGPGDVRFQVVGGVGGFGEACEENNQPRWCLRSLSVSTEGDGLGCGKGANSLLIYRNNEIVAEMAPVQLDAPFFRSFPALDACDYPKTICKYHHDDDHDDDGDDDDDDECDACRKCPYKEKQSYFLPLGTPVCFAPGDCVAVRYQCTDEDTPCVLVSAERPLDPCARPRYVCNDTKQLACGCSCASPKVRTCDYRGNGGYLFTCNGTKPAKRGDDRNLVTGKHSLTLEGFTRALIPHAPQYETRKFTLQFAFHTLNVDQVTGDEAQVFWFLTKGVGPSGANAQDPGAGFQFGVRIAAMGDGDIDGVGENNFICFRYWSGTEFKTVNFGLPKDHNQCPVGADFRTDLQWHEVIAVFCDNEVGFFVNGRRPASVDDGQGNTIPDNVTPVTDFAGQYSGTQFINYNSILLGGNFLKYNESVIPTNDPMACADTLSEVDVGVQPGTVLLDCLQWDVTALFDNDVVSIPSMDAMVDCKTTRGLWLFNEDEDSCYLDDSSPAKVTFASFAYPFDDESAECDADGDALVKGDSTKAGHDGKHCGTWLFNEQLASDAGGDKRNHWQLPHQTDLSLCNVRVRFAVRFPELPGSIETVHVVFSKGYVEGLVGGTRVSLQETNVLKVQYIVERSAGGTEVKELLLSNEVVANRWYAFQIDFKPQGLFLNVGDGPCLDAVPALDLDLKRERACAWSENDAVLLVGAEVDVENGQGGDNASMFFNDVDQQKFTANQFRNHTYMELSEFTVERLRQPLENNAVSTTLEFVDCRCFGQTCCAPTQH